VAIERRNTKQLKQLPAPNSDFYVVRKLFSANPARIGRFDGPPTSDAVPASLAADMPLATRPGAAGRNQFSNSKR